MLSNLILAAAFIIAQGSTLNTAPTKERVEATPVPGSKVLLTGFEVAPASATEFIISKFLELEKSVGVYENLNAKEKETADQKIRQIVSSVLDLDHMGKRAMLAYWDRIEKLPEGQSKLDEYLKLFKQLVEENYLEKARTYVSGKYRIPLLSEDKEGAHTYVRGKIRKEDVDLLLEFKIKEDAGRYRAVDVKLDETSLESTYRSSFNRIIRGKDSMGEGFDELMRVMKVRLEELKKGEATRL